MSCFTVSSAVGNGGCDSRGSSFDASRIGAGVNVMESREGEVRPFSLLVKPAAADCNLRCRYCFYLDRAELYPEVKSHRMSSETLQQMISGYMQTDQPTYAFGWQGGEPTLMGLPFFREVTDMQQAYGSRGSVVANGFQTNGVLIDDDWAEHFARYRFLLGVSVDGPQRLHDKSRRDIGGKGSFERIMEGIGALRRHGVEYNILTLVNSANVRYPEEIYDFLCASGEYYHQYIECVEFDQGKQQPFAINGREWGDFMCRIFDRWYPRDVRRVSIRLFDTIIEQLVFNRDNTCAAGRACDQYFVVEYNGDIYPCDFHVREDLHLGNIFSDDWAKVQRSEVYRGFAAAKSAWPKRCAECKWLRHCHGDCPKNRINSGRGVSHLCEGWRRFYAHAVPRLTELAQEVKLQVTRG
ncbi:MAG: anaerobic sulfatase maturase [Lentisphaerae bacterium]|nr:anaerobic sulfatase maturase [Lentisphaerota bacterium]